MTQLTCTKVQPSDFKPLIKYYEALSPTTKSRFGPHKFDRVTLMYLYQATHDHLGYLLKSKDQIIGYSVVRKGYLSHDADRLQGYGLELSKNSDCTFAPSLTDDYHGMGYGRVIFNFILSEIRTLGFKRIILWGGVQANNYGAIRYYEKLGFKTLGEFEYQGLNRDMILDI